jgi:exosome complex component rrp40
LEKIGSKFKYEITVGMNGRVWVKSPSISGTMFICNSLSQLEHKKDSEIEKYCENIFHLKIK